MFQTRLKFLNWSETLPEIRRFFPSSSANSAFISCALLIVDSYFVIISFVAMIQGGRDKSKVNDKKLVFAHRLFKFLAIAVNMHTA